MKAARKGVALALALGFTLVACGSDDEGGTSADTAAAVTTAEATATTAASTASTAAPGSTASGSESTTAGSGSASGAPEINAAASAVTCPDSEPGLTDTSMLIGGTYPLSGPVAAYGVIPQGVDAWFQHLNDTQGGITSADGKTRKITWKFLDDQYSPPSSLENVRRLVEQEKVWLVLNPLGTPSNVAIRDYMNQAKVPQLMVATGASQWGKLIDKYPYTIGWQPDYESEGIAYAKYALEKNPDAKIGVLYANDDFGKDYIAGIKEGLGDKGDQLISEVTYETSDATVDNQVSQVKDSGADVFMLIATPKFAIQGIQRVAALGWEPLKIVTAVSSSVAGVIEPAGADIAKGWVSDTYAKDPNDPEYANDPAVMEYKEILAKYYPDANPGDNYNVFGFNIAQTFQHLLESMDNVCRDSVMAAIKNFEWSNPPLLSPGIGIKTGPGDAFPIQQVQLMEWDGTMWQKFPDIIDASKG